MPTPLWDTQVSIWGVLGIRGLGFRRGGGGKYPRRDMRPEIPTPTVNRHTPVKYNITLPQPLLRVVINVPAFAVT